MRSSELLMERFRDNGLKITPQRWVILELLADDDSHPTAEQAYQRILSVMPGVSRTTVYNTLRELSDLGELTPVLDFRADGQRYDTNSEAHHHWRCLVVPGLRRPWRPCAARLGRRHRSASPYRRQ